MQASPRLFVTVCHSERLSACACRIQRLCKLSSSTSVCRKRDPFAPLTIPGLQHKVVGGWVQFASRLAAVPVSSDSQRISVMRTTHSSRKTSVTRRLFVAADDVVRRNYYQTAQVLIAFKDPRHLARLRGDVRVSRAYLVP